MNHNIFTFKKYSSILKKSFDKKPPASPVPTASSVPTATPVPTTSPVPTASSVPTTSPVPTASSAPTTSPVPTASPNEYVEEKKYNTYEFTLKNNDKKNIDCNKDSNDCRKVFIVIPNNDSQMPENGWPYLIFFSLLNNIGNPDLQENYDEITKSNTINDLNLIQLFWSEKTKNIVKKNCYKFPHNVSTDIFSEIDDTQSNIWFQLLFQFLLNAGIAIIMTTESSWDSYFYKDCIKGHNDSLNNVCWNGIGTQYENLYKDEVYLKQLFDLIYNLNQNNINQLKKDYNIKKVYKTNLEKLFINKQNDCNIIKYNVTFNTDLLKLDYNRIGFIGYSVGSQMTSRCINDFYNLKTINNIPFPKISVAMMVSGGSLECYKYCDGEIYTKDTCNLQNNDPILNFKEDCNNKNNSTGCCPIDYTEPNYHNGTLDWSEHPPVILVQNKCDTYADPNASIFYYNALQKNNVISELITGAGDTHNLFPSAIIPSYNFLIKYL